nr:MAG TPA: hypothetical protein [Caudoviricetes sp.]
MSQLYDISGSSLFHIIVTVSGSDLIMLILYATIASKSRGN